MVANSDVYGDLALLDLGARYGDFGLPELEILRRFAASLDLEVKKTWRHQGVAVTADLAV